LVQVYKLGDSAIFEGEFEEHIGILAC